MSKRFIAFMMAVVVVVAAAIWFFVFRGSGSQQPSYQTVQASIGSVKEVVSGSGNLEARKTYSVLLQNQGVVDRLSVKTGDTIKLGQELLRVGGKPLYAILGNSPIYRQLASGNTGDDVRWIQQSLDKLGYDTTIDGGYGSSTINALYDFQDAKGLDETSKVGPDTFQAFPLPLVAMDVAVEQGQSVSVGTVAMTLADPRDLQVVVNVNEIDLPKIKISQAVDITIDALPGKTFAGKVASISPGLVASQSSTSGSGQSQSSGSSSSSSSQTGVVNYPVTISLTSTDPQLKAGMTANADIVVAAKDNVLTVPAAAIRDRGDRKMVMVLNSQGQITPTQVEVGTSSDSNSEILSGLQEGQNVVVGFASLNGAGSGGQGQSGSGSGGFRMPFGGGGMGGQGGFRQSSGSSGGGNNMRQSSGGFGGPRD